ncbi:MAG: hypothetical protein ACOC1X_02255 [Promethearchaeota archaeon]
MGIKDKRYKENELEEHFSSYQVKDPEHIVRRNILRRIGEYELEADVYTLQYQEMANYLKNQMDELLG